jgi:hypothetical protein
MDNDEQIYAVTGLPVKTTELAESAPTPEPPPTQVFLQMVDSGNLLSWTTERSGVTNE